MSEKQRQEGGGIGDQYFRGRLHGKTSLVTRLGGGKRNKKKWGKEPIHWGRGAGEMSVRKYITKKFSSGWQG